MSTAQLRELGISPRAAHARMRRGLLHRLHRGVYAVGHGRIGVRARWMAAVLAGGKGAALFGRSAAACLGFAADDRAAVHVVVPRRLRDPAGIRFHHSSVPADQIIRFDGIPVTVAPRALIDLAGQADEMELQRAVHEAEVQRRCDPGSLRAALDQRPHRRGALALRRILAMSDGRSPPTRSELEDRFLRFLDRHGLPMPITNQRVRTPRGTFEVDCYWPDARLVVELDGARYHSTGVARQRDTRKERALVAAGLVVSHVTWWDLEEGEEELALDLSAPLLKSARQAGGDDRSPRASGAGPAEDRAQACQVLDLGDREAE